MHSRKMGNYACKIECNHGSNTLLKACMLTVP